MNFLKDACAIANTVGLDGYIVIGFDEKTKELTNVKFDNSGLRDSNEINGIISRNVDPFLQINTFDMIFGKLSLSILHIPVSLEKPHVIRNYVIT